MAPRRRASGTVHLVGAGPGDPGLLTVRGRDLLARADVVICDALVPSDVLGPARSGAEIIRAGAPGGRRKIGQDSINRMMVARARRGLCVVRLKGGDPSLFGRGGEEAEALARARIPFTIVPGVTAALGAAAAAGIPLTHRAHASSVAIATGHLDPSKRGEGINWPAMAGAGTLVFYMGVDRLRLIVNSLLAAGRSGETPAALVRWATRPDQQVLTGTLGTIPDLARRARLKPPALLIAGEVVRLRPLLDWFGRRPLSGRTFVVTRPRDQAASFTSLLEERGARVLESPAIALGPPRSWTALDRALGRISEYRILIFTSANGVAGFFARLAARRVDLRALHGIDVIAIGPGTAAALEARGLRVAAVPEEFWAEGIVAVLGGRDLRGVRVLLPRAEVARDLLVRALRRRGARVDATPVYRAVGTREGVEEVRRALRRGEIDLLTFASSSTVTHFVRKFRRPAEARRLRRVPAAVIGPITAATARRHGFRVAVMPRDYTIPALAEAIERRFRSFPSGTLRVSSRPGRRGPGRRPAAGSSRRGAPRARSPRATRTRQ